MWITLIVSILTNLSQYDTTTLALPLIVLALFWPRKENVIRL